MLGSKTLSSNDFLLFGFSHFANGSFGVLPKSEDYLKEQLFTSMSAIDFDGDGRAAEYGSAYIALTPLSTTEQPFNFGEFKGQYRWYN